MAVGVLNWKTATIALNASLSDSHPMVGDRIVAIGIPGTGLGTATVFSFQASYDGGKTFVELYDESGPVAITKLAGATQIILLNEDSHIFGPTHIKVRNGASGAATNASGSDQLVYLAHEDVGFGSRAG